MEVVTTLATIPAVLALVQLAKQWGVTGRAAMLLAVILGVVIQVGEYAVYAANTYTAIGWYEAFATGLILGLSASGLYDVARISGPDNKSAPSDMDMFDVDANDDDPVGALTD